MKIYLFESLLVQSQAYENPFKESERRDKFLSGLERDWSIGLWNSQDKLTVKEDGTSSTNLNTIEVRLFGASNRYKLEFREYNLSNPEKILSISSYHSFIETPRDKIMDIVHQLEQVEIDCIVCSNGGNPLPTDYDYASPKIKEKLNKRINVKTITL